ncbi:uncharacterized protein LOC116342905 [Contarinia nasturtii]|uniref:uncharacterized protein LOC116342905 n=1 Tax=Contarinia nasturtii TaxID=265458 RepID=UPI0012D39779|nr:uncharacterized protein LOC116342905 [Contarinia nasturtii]
MSTSSVISEIANPFPGKKRTMKLFHDLLSDMRHQRVAVIALAVGQAAFAHSALFLVCLGLIHAKQMSRLLLIDRLDQKEREEYYETPKIHGVSANDIRFLEAEKLVNYTLILLYTATALAAVYALCTLGLLIGVIKRRCELILPWIIFQSIVCVLCAMTLFVAYACPSDFFARYMGTAYFCRWMISLLTLFINMLCLILVLRYYKGLKMLKRLTEEVVIPIPYHAVPFHFRKENMYVGTGGYKHLLSESNYVL